jgi:NADPH-dependent ferric siderophore reductase
LVTLQIAFGYPRRGLEGTFNTFRLGSSWEQKCQPNDVVDLVDARSKKVLKRATVLRVFVGTLTELAAVHARWAHNWKDYPPERQAALLVESMKKRYPPNRVTDSSIVSVIYLRELVDGDDRSEEGGGRLHLS